MAASLLLKRSGKSEATKRKAPAESQPGPSKKQRVETSPVQVDPIQDDQQAIANLIKLSDARTEKAERALAEYKAELDRLAGLLLLPPDERDVLARLQTKENECDALKAELSALKASSTDKDREIYRLQEWSKQSSGVRKELSEKEQQIAQLTKELEQETEHSKSLQSKLSSKSSSVHLPSTSKDPATEEQLSKRLALASDLTGLLIQSSILTPEGWSYTCILSDVKTLNKSFSFKLTEHQSKREYSYQPSYDPKRDANLGLSPEFHQFMHFALDMAPAFFTKLWTEINELGESGDDEGDDDDEEEEDAEASFV